MQINDLFGNVPAIIGNFISHIYCASKSDDVLYKLEYTGKTIKINTKEPYSNLIKLLDNNKDLLNDIENSNQLKKILNNKVFYTESVDDYKIILVCDMTVESTTSSDKLTLLIADDSPVITKFFSKTFEDEFNILVANNGEEAINMINDNLNNETLVGAFIDLQMPIKSGYDVLEYLSENNLFELLPTSVISGEDSQNGIEKATNYGIIDMLQKPFNAEAAKSIINKTIQHSKNYKNHQ